MTISSWLNFGRPEPPGRGSAAGRNFLAPPYYSQPAVFASLWALFFLLKVVIPLSVYGLDYEVFNDLVREKLARFYETSTSMSAGRFVPIPRNWGRGKGHFYFWATGYWPRAWRTDWRHRLDCVHETARTDCHGCINDDDIFQMNSHHWESTIESTRRLCLVEAMRKRPLDGRSTVYQR